ncbi:MAG: CDGSH iron-sulfur domain-containing protein [Bacteroidales bacterium]|jgi:CDGSH-type Zn-finger protein|nr:CDGSH iron-sulfur domain-containing protein [Bacteroidales bacterium]
MIRRNKPGDTIIEMIENGPLKITGKIILSDQKRGITRDTDEVYLCRCGKSENKPFCDGSHRK